MNASLKFCTSITLSLTLTTLAQAASDCHHCSRWQLRTTAVGILADVESDALDLDAKDTADLAADLTFFITPCIAINAFVTYVNLDASSEGNSSRSTELLLPIMTVQYHFNPAGKFTPYVGAGFSYQRFFHESGGFDEQNQEIDDTFGIVGQVGMDYFINRNILLNLDYKYVTFEADVEGDTEDELDVDASIIGGGIGYRF
jgi:outer membrane protein